jgi:hypothetical protein
VQRRCTESGAAGDDELIPRIKSLTNALTVLFSGNLSLKVAGDDDEDDEDEEMQAD